MGLLFESWCVAGENWRNSSVYLSVTETSGSVRRGVKKWLTRQELNQKLGKEVADAIINFKLNCAKLSAEEIREHPDAPGCEAPMHNLV